ncbi:protein kinase BUB1 PWA37_002534 [Arxiozyma heterogenica]|uniref:protein kinase BUB1 n=1 Tax=Arxiozyma heterogenica TaxID=278026 RepID=UPI002F028472
MLAQQVYHENNEDIDSHNNENSPVHNHNRNHNINNEVNRYEEKFLFFENRLLNELEDLDDPLELFLEYINFINDLGLPYFENKLKLLLERCINYIFVLGTYSNDPRFVKIWFFYLDLFIFDNDVIQYQNNLLFMFLNGVGQRLAMLYIEWANMFWNLKQFDKSLLILEYGMKQNSRPIKRLQDMLKDLHQRLLEMKIHITPFPMNHWDIFIQELIQNSNTPSFITHKITSTNTGTNHNISKIVSPVRQTPLQIFADTTDTSKISKPKPSPVYQINQIEGRLPEKIDCNFDLIYNSKYQYGEIGFEELLSLMKPSPRNIENPGLLSSSLSVQAQPKNSVKRNAFEVINIDTDESNSIKRQKMMEQLPSSQPPINNSKIQIFDDRDATVEYNTKISLLPLKEEEDNNLTTNNTNTVTFFSKDAINEVYCMFNQNLNENNNSSIKDINHSGQTNKINTNILNDNHKINNYTTDNTTNKFSIYENITQDLTRPNIDDLTEVKVPEDTNQVDSISKTDVPNPSSNPISINNIIPNEDHYGNIYPIEERTENSIHTPIYQPSQALQSQSSPFISQPSIFSQKKNSKNENELVQLPSIISHPLSDDLRQLLLSKLSPPLSEYDSFFRYNQKLNMSHQLERIHKITKSSQKKLPIINFTKINKFYCIHSELGRGGYAIVYLAESDDGSLNALKVEKPANSWEYYILRQVELRLKDQHNVLRSIININSLHFFQDESYLILNYANQGTILDLVNLYREDMNGYKTLDELVCIFFTIELIKVIEALHEIKIIHGDLKPDNCMIRLLPIPNGEQLGNYNRFGDEGWNQKGIYLIDFGRSFDLTFFSNGTRFKSDWPIDEQDCYEMRHGLPWSYECDYFGLAGIIYCMLFGKFMETVTDSGNNRIKLRQSLKRGWQKDIWNELFDLLLNSGQYDLPITNKIKIMRLKMEDHILKDEHNCSRLRSSILQIENELSQIRNKHYYSQK